jgi:hypothetical protein
MRCSNGFRPIPEFCFRALAGGLLLLALGAALAESDDAVEVVSADSNVYDGWHVLDASIRFALDDELFVALEHGVQLNIDVLVEIRRQRKWLWDPVISSHRLGFVLQHHPLTGAYVVTEPIAGTRHEFPDAREALKFLGTIRNYHLLNADLLTRGEVYDGYIKARLNIDALPAPLQPVAYVSRKWRVESDWLKWSLTEP